MLPEIIYFVAETAAGLWHPSNAVYLQICNLSIFQQAANPQAVILSNDVSPPANTELQTRPLLPLSN